MASCSTLPPLSSTSLTDIEQRSLFLIAVVAEDNVVWGPYHLTKMTTCSLIASDTDGICCRRNARVYLVEAANSFGTPPFHPGRRGEFQAFIKP